MQIHLDFLSEEIEGHTAVIMDRAGWQVIKSTSLKNRVFQIVDEIIDASIDAWNIFVRKEDQIRKTCYRKWANISQLI